MLLLDTLPDRPFTTSEARACGLSRFALDRLVAERLLRRVLHGVYQWAQAPDTIESRVDAARLVLRPGAVFCDRTAAWLHGVDVLDYSDLDVVPPLECVVLRGRSRVDRRECDGGERDLRDGDIMSLSGVRLTTPLRTALDLGCALSRPEALAAFDAFARVHGVSQDDLQACLPRYRGRRGVVRMRQLVPLVDARSESPGESRSRLLIQDEGLPPPVPQFWVLHRGHPLFRLDLAWPKHRVAVEYDGAWHELTDSQRVADLSRRDWLQRHGWTVIVIRSGELGRGTSQPWLRDLRIALGR